MAQTPSWWGYRGWPWRRHAVPVLVWLLAIGVAGRLFMSKAPSCELTGIAHADQRAVTSQVDGRLRLMPVELLQSVKQGQALAVLEDDRIQATLATAAAQVARLRAELVAAEDRLATEASAQEAEHTTEARRCAIDVEQARLRMIELRVAIETSRDRLNFLRLQKDLLENLRRQEAVSELAFRSGEAEYSSLETNIKESEKALAQAGEDLERARERQAAFSGLHVKPLEVDKAIEPLRAAVTVQERVIAELSIDRSMLVIESPMDGIVSQILRRAGEAVTAGEAILTVVSQQPTEIIAYASAGQVARMEPGAPVRLQVVRDGRDVRSAEGYVVAVSPNAEQVPTRLWRASTAPEWGWPLKISIPPELELLSGEVVGVIE